MLEKKPKARISWGATFREGISQSVPSNGEGIGGKGASGRSRIRQHKRLKTSLATLPVTPF